MMKQLSEIDQEIAAVEARLSENEEFKRLITLREFREKHVAYMAAYNETFGVTAPDGEVIEPRDEPSTFGKDLMNERKKATPTSLIVTVAQRRIESLGRPILTAELLAYLEEVGHVVGGANPKANLSTKLSASDEVYFHKPVGWWLKSRRHELVENAEGPANGLARPSQQDGSEIKL